MRMSTTDANEVTSFPSSLIIILFLFTGIFTLSTSSLKAQSLNLYMTASSEVVGPADKTTYSLLATNNGSSDLTDVSVAIQLPDYINQFNLDDFTCTAGCDANETATWQIGTLSAGSSAVVYYQVQITDDASEGTISSFATATANGSSDASASLDVEITPSPILRLSLAPESGPAVAGESFSYTLTYGNIGTVNLTDATLAMDLPSGTTFSSATAGGAESGGTVNWNLGALGTGGSGQVQVTVMVDNSLTPGDALEARATLSPNVANEPDAVSSFVTPLGTSNPLQVEFSLSQTAVSPGDPVDVTLIASNTGQEIISNINLKLLFPDFAEFPSYVNQTITNQTLVMPIEQLEAGETQTSIFRMFVSEETTPGAIGQFLLQGTAPGLQDIISIADIHIIASPVLKLGILPETSHAQPGQAFQYSLTYGNRSTTVSRGATLELIMPENTGFSSASNTGKQEDNIIRWDLPDLQPGEGGKVTATVVPNSDLPEGSILTATALIDPGLGNEKVIRSNTIASLKDQPPTLQLIYNANVEAIGQRQKIIYEITASNLGTSELSNIGVGVILPGYTNRFNAVTGNFNCQYCSDGVAAGLIPSILPGESQQISFSVNTDSDAPLGEILRSYAFSAVNPDGSNLVISGSDVIIGELQGETSNNPPVVENEIPDFSVAPNSNFEYTTDGSTFSDPEGGLLYLSASLGDGTPLPRWLSFTDNGDNTATFSGISPESGSYAVKLTATDEGGLSTSTSFLITVESESNDPPVVVNVLPDAEILVGEFFEYIIPENTFMDPEGGDLSLSATLADDTDLPDWINFVDNGNGTGLFSGTPNETGTWSVKVTASDAEGLSVTDSFQLTVSGINQCDEFFVVVEKMPVLIDGIAGLQERLRYPESSRMAETEGRVFVQFLVTRTGNVIDPAVIRGIEAEADSEAVRVVRTARFEPGLQRGEPVCVQFSLPVVFSLTPPPPVVTNPIADQEIQPNQPFSLEIPSNTFEDPDGTIEKLDATQRNLTELPSWLRFIDNGDGSGKLSGTPPEAGILIIELTATDSDNLMTFTRFELNVGGDVSSSQPAIPTGLNLTHNGSSVELSWNANSESDLQGYNIYRGYDAVSMSLETTVSASTTSYSDPNVEDRPVYYSISAVNTSDLESWLARPVSMYRMSKEINTGWQLIGSPLQTGNGTSLPNGLQLVGFDGAYHIAGVMEPQRGYWAKDDESTEIVYDDVAQTTATYQLEAGWNLISGVADTISTSNIIDNSNILSAVAPQRYTGTAYADASEIAPTEGYFIHAQQPGTIVLETTIPAPPGQKAIPLATSPQKEQEMTQPDRLEFVGAGASQTFYITNQSLSAREKQRFLVPPIPPDAALDIRTYDGHRLAEGRQTELRITAARYPVRVRLAALQNDQEYAYQLVAIKRGVEVQFTLSHETPVEIDQKYDRYILKQVSASELPLSTSLLPNYPNPFNPSTTVKYQLSATSQVNLAVFDLLGRKVQTLVDQRQQPGVYTLQFNAENLSSGMYFLSIQAGEFNQIQKMTLIK